MNLGNDYSASVRVILHNSFYRSKIKYWDQLLSGTYDSFVSQESFDLVRSTMLRNPGRSETLQPRPEREYLLKGRLKCAHCEMSLWAQTLASSSFFYREQDQTCSPINCPGESKSISCEIADDQIGRIVRAVSLPDAWTGQLLPKIHLCCEVKRVREKGVELKGD